MKSISLLVIFKEAALTPYAIGAIVLYALADIGLFIIAYLLFKDKL